jgi:hypothetical protein
MFPKGKSSFDPFEGFLAAAAMLSDFESKFCGDDERRHRSWLISNELDWRDTWSNQLWNQLLI